MKTYAATILILASFSCLLVSVSTSCCKFLKTTSQPSKTTTLPCNACPTEKVSPLPYLDVQGIIDISPLFVYYLQRNIFTENYVTQCYSFLQINNTSPTDILFVTTTNKDGMVSVHAYFGITGTEGPGSFEYVGLSGTNLTTGVIIYSYLIDTFCTGSQTVYNIKRIVAAQDCTDGDLNLSPYTMLSTSLDPDQKCLEKALKALKRSSGNAKFTKLTNSSMNCVVSLNGAFVANYDRILRDSRINGIAV